MTHLSERQWALIELLGARSRPEPTDEDEPRTITRLKMRLALKYAAYQRFDADQGHG